MVPPDTDATTPAGADSEGDDQPEPSESDDRAGAATERALRPVARPRVPRELNVARAGALLVAVEVLSVVVGFASTVYFAQALGARLLGTFFLFEAALSTVAVVADFGLRGAVEKRVSEGEEAREFVGAGLLLKLGALAVVCGVAWTFRATIDGYVGAQVTGLLVVAAVLLELATLSMHVLRGELRADQTAVVYLLRLLTYVGVSVALLQADYGVQALLYGLVASYAVMLVVGVARVSTWPARPGRRHVRSLVDYAKFNGVWGLGGFVYNTMDVLVVGFFIGQAAVGAYELAWRVTTMTAVVGSVVANATFAQLSAWVTQGATDRVRETVRDATTASLFLVVPAFFGVAVLAEELLGIVFGAEYAIAAGAFVVLMGEKLVSAVNVVLDATVRAYDRPDVGAYATAASLTLNVVLNVALVPPFGLVGAATATGVSMLVNTLVLGGFLRRVAPVEFAVADLAWTGVAGAAMAGALLAARSVVAVDSALPLVALVALGAAVYAAVVLASPSLRRQVFAGVRDATGR